MALEVGTIRKEMLTGLAQDLSNRYKAIDFECAREMYNRGKLIFDKKWDEKQKIKGAVVKEE